MTLESGLGGKLEKEWKPNKTALLIIGIVMLIPAVAVLAAPRVDDIQFWYVLGIVLHFFLTPLHRSLGAFFVGTVASVVALVVMMSDRKESGEVAGSAAIYAAGIVFAFMIPASYRVELYTNQLVIRLLVSTRRMPLENIEDVEDTFAGALALHHGGKEPVKVWLITGAREAAETITVASRRARESVANRVPVASPAIGGGKFCTKCGASNAQDSKFCGACGQPA